MPRHSKMRNIDYSVDEMIQLIKNGYETTENKNKATEHERRDFERKLKRICDMHGINIDDFKSDREIKSSTYFFPPNIAEWLALLLRRFNSHPLQRANADIKKMKAYEFAEYNEGLLKDIDEKLSEKLKKVIYCCNEHYTAVLIDEWLSLFEEEFIIFIMGIIRMKENSFGTMIKYLTKNLSDINYGIFVDDYQYVDELELSENNKSPKTECEDWSMDGYSYRHTLEYCIVQLIKASNKLNEKTIEYDFPNFEDMYDIMVWSDKLTPYDPIIQDKGNVVGDDICKLRKAYNDLEYFSSNAEKKYDRHRQRIEEVKKDKEEWLQNKYKNLIVSDKEEVLKDAIEKAEFNIIQLKRELRFLQSKSKQNQKMEEKMRKERKYRQEYEKYRLDMMKALKDENNSYIDSFLGRILYYYFDEDK